MLHVGYGSVADIGAGMLRLVGTFLLLLRG